MVLTLEKQKKDVSHKVVDVDPRMANQWLEGNHKKQRSLSQKKVNTYAASMENGDWQFTGEPLIFDTNGDLINGQHRLMAVIRSGCTIPFMVISGVDEKSYNYIDIGKKRSAADVLYSNGFKFHNMAASIAKFCINFPRRMESGARNMDNPPTNQEVLEFAQSKLTPNFLAKIHRWKRAFGKIMPYGKIGGFYYLFSLKDAAQANEFMHLLISGERLEPDSPILLLRHKLIKNSLSDKKYNRVTFDALVIMTWNYWRLDKKPKVLKWTRGGREKFPEIV